MYEYYFEYSYSLLGEVREQFERKLETSGSV